jgi:hypothetical protein
MSLPDQGREIDRLAPFPDGKSSPTRQAHEARAEAELFLVGNPHISTRHWGRDGAIPRRCDS